MINKLKIGFLAPYSSIYPYYGLHLTAGFYCGLGQDPMRSNVQVINEYAGGGKASEFNHGVKKLLQFDHVDILSGMVGYKVIRDALKMLDRREGMGFFHDLGEMFPLFDQPLENIFFNSHQLYQSEYALGHWAHKTFGSKGIILMPIYNSGFHLHRAFEFGAGDAGAKEIVRSVIPYKPDNPHHLDIDYAFDQIHKYNPAFVHAMFVGPQGNEFLAKWSDHQWTKSIPLLVAENMIYSDMIQDVANLNLELYSAISWNERSETVENRHFVKRFRQVTGQPPNIYALLGYESGLFFKEVLRHMMKRDWDTVKTLLRTEKIRGPRGERKLLTNHPTDDLSIDIVKYNSFHGDLLTLDLGSAMSPTNANLSQNVTVDSSGWTNPYLCI
ncbi:MAG: ABC transporter substrate-binding protein [Bacteroidota bacterium]